MSPKASRFAEDLIEPDEDHKSSELLRVPLSPSDPDKLPVGDENDQAGRDRFMQIDTVSLNLTIMNKFKESLENILYTAKSFFLNEF